MSLLNTDISYADIYAKIQANEPVEFEVTTVDSELSEIEQNFINNRPVKPVRLNIDLPASTIAKALIENSINQLSIKPFECLRLVAEFYACNVLFEGLGNDLWSIKIIPAYQFVIPQNHP